MTGATAEAVRQAAAANRERLLARTDVIAVARGRRTVGGVDTGERCVKVFVPRKLPPEALSPARLLPASVAAPDDPPVLVDVEEMAQPTVPPLHRATAAALMAPPAGGLIEELRDPQRPLRGGVSLAHYAFPTGTLAVGARDNRFSGAVYALSCNHVLARSNLGLVGDVILQPAPGDGGCYPAAAVARLARYVPLRFNGPGNLVDAALGYAPPGLVASDVYWLGRPPAVRRAAGIRTGEPVVKVGRTTGLTRGRVVAVEASLKLTYVVAFVALAAVFHGQIITTDMCGYGDSGSLLLDEQDNAVGMLFSGSPTHTIYNPAEFVQRELGVTVAERME